MYSIPVTLNASCMCSKCCKVMLDTSDLVYWAPVRDGALKPHHRGCGTVCQYHWETGCTDDIEKLIQQLTEAEREVAKARYKLQEAKSEFKNSWGFDYES